MSSPAASIQTRTLLRSSTWQIPMPHNLRFRKENLQIPEKVNESRFLLSCHGVILRYFAKYPKILWKVS